MSGKPFSDANRPPAGFPEDNRPLGGVGDVNSNARGTGARLNAGKPPLELIPLALIARSMVDPLLRHPHAVLPAVVSAVTFAGEFQTTGDVRALDSAIQALSASGYWAECAFVFGYGREKYAPWNWAKGMAWSVPLGCIGRHALDIMSGESFDSESKRLHEGHILCNLVMLRTYVDSFPEGNDLPDPALFKPAARFITAGMDVSDNRIEVSVQAWAAGARLGVPYEDLEAVSYSRAGLATKIAETETIAARVDACAKALDSVSMDPPAVDDEAVEGIAALPDGAAHFTHKRCIRSVIVYGPQGCGKTLNAKALANYFGLATILDDWTRADNGTHPPKFDALILTNDPSFTSSFDVQNGRDCWTYEAAMRAMETGIIDNTARPWADAPEVSA